MTKDEKEKPLHQEKTAEKTKEETAHSKTAQENKEDKTAEKKEQKIQQKPQKNSDDPSIKKSNAQQTLYSVTQNELLAKREVSLWLDNYDDIFSDFDPRPHSQRALSDDFLVEAKRAVRETKKGELLLRFLVPTSSRSNEQETIIKKRLREHFKKYAERAQNEITIMKRNGMLLTGFGFLLLVIATMTAYYDTGTLLSAIFIVLLEPSGWFALWTGLDNIIYDSKTKQPEAEFYKRMTKAEISFESI